MRTTFAIDDDVLSVARELAETQGTSVGAIISALTRKALQPESSQRNTRNGIPLLSVAKGVPPVTSELVKQMMDELP